MKKIIIWFCLFGISFGALGQESQSTDEILMVAEQMPAFDGGKKALIKYLEEKLLYPEYEYEQSIEGTVYLSFVVMADGKISNPQVMSGVEGAKNFDKEAIRVVTAMPAWIPGLHSKQPVNVRFSLPIEFKLKGRWKKK